MTQNCDARLRCPADRKRQLLIAQRFVCVYCAVPFGSVIRRRSRRMSISVVNFDHVIPFSYLNRNPRNNWVAACNVCNSIKAGKMLGDIADARLHIQFMWEHKGIEVAWLAPVSSEEDPEVWAVKFGTFLAGMPAKTAGTIRWARPTRLVPKAVAS